MSKLSVHFSVGVYFAFTANCWVSMSSLRGRWNGRGRAVSVRMYVTIWFSLSSTSLAPFASPAW